MNSMIIFRKKLLFIISSLSGGGVERVFINLLRNLNRSRFKSLCVFYNYPQPYKLPEGIEKVFNLELPGTNNIFKKLLFSSKRIMRFASFHSSNSLF